MTEPHSDQPVGAAAQTVKEQATQVMDEVRTQTSTVAHQVRERVAEEARTQNDRLADGLRTMAGELQQMAADRPDTPARAVVERIAESGQQAAEYLSKHGPDGVLAEVQEFARRRPGAFVVTALVSGFVVGRLGKAVVTKTSSPQPSDERRMPPPVDPTLPMFQTGVAQVPQSGVAQAPQTGVAQAPQSGVAQVSETGAAAAPQTGVARVPEVPS